MTLLTIKEYLTIYININMNINDRKMIHSLFDICRSGNDILLQNILEEEKINI